MNAKVTTAFVAVIAAVTFTVSGPVSAQTSASAGNGQVSKTVRFSDLDLSKPADVSTLYRRIQDAAWRVCSDLVPVRNGPSGIEHTQCRQALVDAAVGELNKPALTALHAGKTAGNLTARR
jgi:UrcA family protein